MRNSSPNTQLAPRTAAGAAVCLVTASFLLSAVAGAAGAGTAPLYPEIRIVTAEEVLSDWTATGPDGALYFTALGGTTWRFVTTTDAAEIANPGDGSFHPVSEDGVLATLDETPPCFLEPLKVTIYLLPYPREGVLSSSADSLAIYLSPGVYPYLPAAEARLVAHELGHCVHFALLPDEDAEGWDTYESLRGITDSTVFNATAPHAYRPHEIFAEDFRVLFGGDLASGDGSVENPDLLPPTVKPELVAFFYEIAGADPAPVASVSRTATGGASWAAFPNPARAGEPVVVRRRGAAVAGASGLAEVAVFDASGRRRAGGPVAGTSAADIVELPRTDAFGRELPSGAYWVKVFRADGSVAATVSLRVIR